MGDADERRASFDAYVAEATDRYQDVLDALHAAEIPAEMTQTGGRCLAITFPWGTDGYFLLTDYDDVLSFDRDEAQGWLLGLYDGTAEPVEFDLELADLVKTPGSAVKLAWAGITEASVASRSPRSSAGPPPMTKAESARMAEFRRQAVARHPSGGYDDAA